MTQVHARSHKPIDVTFLGNMNKTRIVSIGKGGSFSRVHMFLGIKWFVYGPQKEAKKKKKKKK